MALSVFGIIVTIIVAIILYVHQKTSLVMASSKVRKCCIYLIVIKIKTPRSGKVPKQTRHELNAIYTYAEVGSTAVP